jgi:predicted RNase H-like HicB family nuclease
MELEGKLWKSGKFWLIEVPAIDVMTQGNTREEALKMLENAIEGLVGCYFPDEAKDFIVSVTDHKKGAIGVSASNNNLMMSFSLRRQRAASQSTVREVAERLGSTSPNAYARYEKGRTRFSVDHYERLLQAANPQQNLQLKVG